MYIVCGLTVCRNTELTPYTRFDNSMGLRHLEIDIWWWPADNAITVCHSPVPLWPVGQINRKAEEAGLDLQWDPKDMCCVNNRRAFADVLQDIKDWMDKHDDEFVVLYIDTKPPLQPSHVDMAQNDIAQVFGV